MLTKIKSGLAGVLVVASTAAVLATGVDNRAASQTKVGTPSSEHGATMLEDRDVPVLLAGAYWGETCTTDEGYGRQFHAEPVLETGRTAASHGLQAAGHWVGRLR